MFQMSSTMSSTWKRGSAIIVGSLYFLLGLQAQIGSAHDEPSAWVGATIYPIDSPPVEDGVLLTRGGKIVAVGPRNSVQLPADVRRYDATGKVILPGLICTHIHIGQVSGADRSSPIQPEARALDSINVRNEGFQRAQAGGITTVNIMPGSGHLISGQTVYLKVKDARTLDDVVLRDDDGNILGGMKMANGTNSRRDPPFPGTRAKSASLVREAYIKAQEYKEKLARANGDKSKAPPRDLGLEALVEVLDKKRVVHHHTHRHDDIMTVLRLADEFDFRVVLHHVSDGWKVAQEIADAKAPCSIIVIDSPGGKEEAMNVDFKTGGVLEKAGVLVGFHTDDFITDSRLFLRSGALAVRAGMTREGALQGLTLAGAKMLDLDQKIGSLSEGKDADFILLSGDPLSVYTHVLETWIEGEKVFDRSRPEDRLFATGGQGASRDREDDNVCCSGWEKK